MAEIVSVVVPVYNTGIYLECFFEHMLGQSFQDFKAYIVYDESTDNSYEIISMYEKKHSDRFEILVSPQKDGLGAARDFALNSGRLQGKYLLFLDPDDYPDEKFIEELVTEAEKTGADITMCGFERFDDKSGKVICTEMVNNPEEIINDISAFDLLAYMNPVVWNKLYRMSLIGDTRFTNIKRTEDVFWLMRLVPKIKSIKCINKSLYHYRVREDSLLNTISEKDYNHIKNGFETVSIELENSGYKNSKYWSVIEFIAFCRFGIGVTYRVSDKKNNKGIAKSTLTMLDAFYPTWRKNRFLKLSVCCKHGIKGIAIWMCSVLHKWHMFGVYIWTYSLMKKITGKEVRW